MRNAVYSGPWVTQAKRRFSKSNCVAYQLGRDYMAGAPIRQAYLETALKWISRGDIDAYMVKHRFDADCDELWQYYQDVIHWVQIHFTERRREMKGVAWGDIYNQYRDAPYKESELRERVRELMKDSDVQSKAGIYWYVFDGDERHLGRYNHHALRRSIVVFGLAIRRFGLPQRVADGRLRGRMGLDPWRRDCHPLPCERQRLGRAAI